MALWSHTPPPPPPAPRVQRTPCPTNTSVRTAFCCSLDTGGGGGGGTPTTGLRERGNDTSTSTGRSGRQNAAIWRLRHRNLPPIHLHAQHIPLIDLMGLMICFGSKFLRDFRPLPTQHAKGRTGDCSGPRKGTATRRNVTRGGGGGQHPPQRMGLQGGLRGCRCRCVLCVPWHTPRPLRGGRLPASFGVVGASPPKPPDPPGERGRLGVRAVLRVCPDL